MVLVTDSRRYSAHPLAICVRSYNFTHMQKFKSRAYDFFYIPTRKLNWNVRVKSTYQIKYNSIKMFASVHNNRVTNLQFLYDTYNVSNVEELKKIWSKFYFSKVPREILQFYN